MRCVSEKLLAIALTLLLGLSPLQGAMAGFAPSSDQEKGMHAMAERHGDMVMDHDCERNNAYDTDNCHSCSSGQCTSCALAVLPVFSHPTNRIGMSGLLRADDGFVSQLASSLFRPPRA